jgi:EmrB/QacA subfamily drug resistance transporter
MKKWSIIGILAIAQFVMVLDSTVMNVSISTIVEDLDTTVNALQGAITFYTLTMAACMLIGARLAAKWGLLKAFVIGSIVYGLGSLITGLSQNIQMLVIGWSFIEGLGAVLVIPAIAALVAVHYKGKDRVTAYAIIGGVSGAAAAAGPLIGGFVTTYFSWRYVFIAETIIMIFVLIASKKFKAQPGDQKVSINVKSALLSSTGLVLLVYGMLQSKVWGWVQPLGAPEINGNPITPFGISLVAYMIIAGLALLVLFYQHELREEENGGNPLLRVSMLSIKQLRSGLSVLFSQYIITAAIFFVVPVYLQMVLGYDALQTGLKILPLSIALIIFSISGAKLINLFNPRQIVRSGQVLLIVGTLFLLASIEPQLSGYSFVSAMFFIGAGLGLLASQIGNINMSAVSDKQSNEVGGLQGTFQNLGSSFGTALIGSVMIASLTTIFISSINSSTLPPDIKDYISKNAPTGMQIVPSNEVEQYAISRGVSQNDAQQITDAYVSAELAGLKQALFVLFAISVISLVLSKNIPTKFTPSK